jgi:ABC-type polar amino acid transport system ATPase subunit
MVFQQLFLWPHLTNRQNITLPDIKITTRPGGFGFEELVEELDLRKVLDRFPNECSVGERQRIALARGLMLNTRFLLLDEVTSALNHDLAQRVVTLLAQAKARQVGQLIVTHDERIFANVATHVAILEDGKLRET